MYIKTLKNKSESNLVEAHAVITWNSSLYKGSSLFAAKCKQLSLLLKQIQ